MKNNLIYREIAKGEEEKVCKLVTDCFDKFIGETYSAKGITEFYKYANSKRLKDSLEEDHFVFLALEGDEIIGVIEMRSFYHIALFFVKESHHKCGIGRKLFNLAVNKCKDNNSELKYISVNASRYAIDIYKKIGFIQVEDEQIKNGIRFTPMKAQI